jgi:hypothetical protein
MHPVLARTEVDGRGEKWEKQFQRPPESKAKEILDELNNIVGKV